MYSAFLYGVTLLATGNNLDCLSSAILSFKEARQQFQLLFRLQRVKFDGVCEYCIGGVGA